MSARPWYKRYGQDFVFGTMGMRLELRGAYSILLDLMYDRNGPLPDDESYFAGVMGITKGRWRKIRKELVELEKITLIEGAISNPRTEEELAARAAFSQERSISGQKGGQKRAKNDQNLRKINPENEAVINNNNGLEEAEVKQARNQSPKSEESPPIPPLFDEPDIVQEAVNLWNALAADIGLSQVAVVTVPRRRSCLKRLKSCGGLAGWKIALEKIRGTPFLGGDNRDGWKVDFDFLMRQSKFTKLMEDGYGGNPTKPSNGKPTDHDIRGSLARAGADLLENERRDSGRSDTGVDSDPAQRDGTPLGAGRGGGDDGDFAGSVHDIHAADRTGDDDIY